MLGGLKKVHFSTIFLIIIISLLMLGRPILGVGQISAINTKPDDINIIPFKDDAEPTQEDNLIIKSSNGLELPSENNDNTESSLIQTVDNKRNELKKKSIINTENVINSKPQEIANEQIRDINEKMELKFKSHSSQILSNNIENLESTSTNPNQSIVNSNIKSISTNSNTTKLLKTIQLGSDNPEKPGQALGYIYPLGASYICKSHYYTVPYYYKTNSLTEYHGWVVFDLQDLKQWSGVRVKSVKLIVHNYLMYYFEKMNFTLLNTTPYDNPPNNISELIYNESGQNGTQIGQYILKSKLNINPHTIEIDLNASVANIINTRINNLSGSYTFGVGIYIRSLQGPYNFGFARWSDPRLAVTFECNNELLKTKEGEGIAFGDDWSGYLYNSTSAQNYPRGFTNTQKYGAAESRSYLQWGLDKIRNTILGNNQTKIYITKLSLRLNHLYYDIDNINFYEIINNVTTTNPDILFNDCGSGKKYLGPVSVSPAHMNEFEFDLGIKAVMDFQKILYNKTKDFFALGVSTSSPYSYLMINYGPRLVLEWSNVLSVHNIDKDSYYPKIQIALDDANPGDTIFVKNGTYNESIIIEKTINLVGESEDRTIINGSGLVNSIFINESLVNISRFTVTGTGINSLIKIYDTRNCRVNNIICLGNNNSVLLDRAINISLENVSMQSGGIFIEGNELKYWNSHNIYNNSINNKLVIYSKNMNSDVISLDAGQIILANCSNYTIKNQNIKNSSASLILGFSNNNMISNNSFSSNTYFGIYLKFSNNNEIENNSCNHNFGSGINIINSSNNSIKYNNCSSNINDGINLRASSNNVIQKNICWNNSNGIYLDYSFSNEILNNSCTFNMNSGIQNVVRHGTIKKYPVDIVLILDTSGSMSGERIFDLKVAATNFINHPNLDYNDRVAIFTFNDTTKLTQDFTVCNASGKSILLNKINNFIARGLTPLWDAIGLAINYTISNGSSRIPIIIAMTDGVDTRSTNYCPWHNWSDGLIEYRDVDNINGHDHFTFSTGSDPSLETGWAWGTLPTANKYRYGLLNSNNVTLYTVGLGLIHNNHSGDSSWRFPGGWMGAYAQYESVQHNWNINRNSSIYNESGTDEYHLWRIANTSGGEYYYAQESFKLNSIFQTLIEKIIIHSADINSTIIGNDVINNKIGIYLKGSNMINNSENNCSNNEYSIKFDYSNNNLIYRNTIMNNSIGIILSSSNNNLIYHNNFMKNNNHSYDYSTNIWNETYPIGGNYWDNWTTPDNDDNGFVDIPYDVPGGPNKDYLPFAEKDGWLNKPPTVKLKVIPIEVNISIRLAGKKWQSIEVELYEDDILVANGTLTRYPGSPNEQMLNLSTVKLDVTRVNWVIIRYTPDNNPPKGKPNGATPCWMIVKYGNNKEIRLHHTFNVNQIQTHFWKVNLTKELPISNLTFEADAYDRDGDDLTLYWEFGDGANMTKFYSNPNPGIPFQLIERVAHKYLLAGIYTVSLTVTDEEGEMATVRISVFVS